MIIQNLDKKMNGLQIGELIIVDINTVGEVKPRIAAIDDL